MDNSSNNSTSKSQSPPPQSPPPPSQSPPPPSSPPPSSSKPPLSQPPLSSPPPSSPPPLSPPPSSTPPPSSPPPSSEPPQSSPPPPSSEPPPPSSPPPSSLQSPPPFSPPPSPSNSSPPPSQNNQSPPPAESNNNTSPPNNNSSSNNTNNNNGGNQWQPPPPPSQSPNPPSANNGSGTGSLTPPSETTNTPVVSSPSGDGSMLSIPLVAVVAAGAGLLIIIMLLLFLATRRKRNKQEDGRPPYYNNHGNAVTDYYAGTGTPPTTNWQTTEPHRMGGDPYYNKAAYRQNHNASDQTSDLHTPPSGPARSGWPTPSQNGVTNGIDTSHDSSSPHGSALPPPSPPAALGFGQSTFTYDELAAATGRFSQANLLGQGGFGYVHKGILPNGKEIAVKSLKSGSGQGEREFMAEVETISRVHHRHLVSLVGYCIAGGQRMLVYEYLPNNNLEFHLHGKGRPIMDWPTRLKIALGSAKGLAYLHEDCHPRIIHRDIKSSNILLDFAFEAKVSDFGLAKITSDNNTHVSTRVMGTFGYLAPEYATSGKLTDKSDVFSFGVMLLELITGRRPVDPTGDLEDCLVDWARPLCLRALEDGNFNELADPYLEKNYPAEEMARMIACAGASIRHSSRRRPKMSQIVRALEGDVSLEDLNNGIKPSQASIFGGGAGSSGVGSTSSRASDFDNSSYAEDLKKLRKIVMDNPSGGPYVSSEYGATSEYGLNPSSSSSEFGGSRGQSP